MYSKTAAGWAQQQQSSVAIRRFNLPENLRPRSFSVTPHRETQCCCLAHSRPQSTITLLSSCALGVSGVAS